MTTLETCGVVNFLDDVKIPVAEIGTWKTERIKRFFYGISVALRSASNDNFGTVESLCLNFGQDSGDQELVVPMLKTIGGGATQLAGLIEDREKKRAGLIDGAGI